MKILELTDDIDEPTARQIQELFFHAFGEETSPEFFERVNQKRDLSVILAYEEEKLVGFKIGYTRYRGIFFSWLGAVAQEHRRKGVARKLLQHQHNYCSSKGYTEIQTEAYGTNSGMLLLNLQEGFSIYGSKLGHNAEISVMLRKVIKE